jgi:hypothetical protein
MLSSCPVLSRQAPLRAMFIADGATIDRILTSRGTTRQTTAALPIPTDLAVEPALKDHPAIERSARRQGGSSRGSTRSEAIEIEHVAEGELVRLLEPGTDAQKVLDRV